MFLHYLQNSFANPSSLIYRQGIEAEAAIRHARRQVASLIATDPKTITFTSGATESANWILRGLIATGDKGPWLVNPTEHRAVLDPVYEFRRKGFQVLDWPLLSSGMIDINFLERLPQLPTLVIAMVANNETGVLNPIEEVGKWCRKRGIAFFTDAAQAVGKIPINLDSADPDFLIFSSHKVYGPKGAGAVYMRKKIRGIEPAPLITGGGQENGKRSGTLNVPAIAGFGKAAEFISSCKDTESTRLKTLRDQFEQAIVSEIPDLIINGQAAPRLPHVSNFSVPGIRPRKLLPALRQLAVSAGSACSTGELQPSHVLKAMNIPETHIHNTIRLSMGYTTTRQEVETAIEHVVKTIKSLRT